MGETPEFHVVDLPLSFAQEQMWFIHEYNHDHPLFNVPVLVRLTGPLDAGALGRAFDAVVARHEVLRTRLTAGDSGRLVQTIDPPAPGGLDLCDLTELGREAARRRLDELAAEAAVRPFRLAQEWLLRARLVRVAPEEHALVVVAHEAAFDDRSVHVLVRELAALYRQEAQGDQPGLADLADLAGPATQFSGHALRERDRLRGRALAELEDYWRTALADAPATQFPTDWPRPLIASHDGAVTTITLGSGLVEGLRQVSVRQGTSLAVTVLAGLLAVLHRYTGQADLVVGMDSANRDAPDTADLIGYLANTLPVRVDVSADPPFTDFLIRVRDALAAARAHQELPFAKVVEALRLDRDTGRWPVYQVAFAYREPSRDTESAGVVFRAEYTELPASKYDISFSAEVRDGGMQVAATYTTALFGQGTVDRLLEHMRVLLTGVAADPSARLARLPMLTDAELRRELTEWNDTATDLPVQCIHQGFEAQAGRTPHAVAAQFDSDQLTYAELNGLANQVARWLRELGVGSQALVGVCLGTGLRRVAVLLGIWKAGGGYVPLDPAAPPERLAFLLADTGMTVVLTDELSGGNLPRTEAAAVLSLDTAWDQIRTLDDRDLTGTGVTPSNVAYVIYTSGSTGQPKGVVVEHRHAINFLHGMAPIWGVGPGGAVLGFAAFTFDVSVMDMFMPLLAGARLVLAPPETLHSPPRLAALIRDANVSFACLPPAVLPLLAGEDFGHLRTLLSAGEELSSDLVRTLLRHGVDLYNGYGPTEASIGSTFMKLEPTTPLPPPIGCPKPNYQAYVLDSHLNPVPAGVIGELHIGGAGVARGYLNRPDLTQERFIPDPFRPGGRLYKTGDLVRRRPDGTLVFAGRLDDQVKIRGLRVELGEIEAALVAHPGVAQAVVTVFNDPAGQRQLAAYLRLSGNSMAESADIREHLASRLPGYMIPAYLITLDQFPLTAHGKIDKAALPAPQPVRATERLPPRTLIETLLVDLYGTTLGTEDVGATDSFFDLGGSSLQAMQLITWLCTTLAVDLDVSAVFLGPTPRQLAALLRDKHGFTDADAEGSEHADGRGADGTRRAVTA